MCVCVCVSVCAEILIDLYDITVLWNSFPFHVRDSAGATFFCRACFFPRVPCEKTDFGLLGLPQ